MKKKIAKVDIEEKKEKEKVAMKRQNEIKEAMIQQAKVSAGLHYLNFKQ